jgi:hypothetical protein
MLPMMPMSRWSPYFPQRRAEDKRELATRVTPVAAIYDRRSLCAGRLAGAAIFVRRLKPTLGSPSFSHF